MAEKDNPNPEIENLKKQYSLSFIEAIAKLSGFAVADISEMLYSLARSGYHLSIDQNYNYPLDTYTGIEGAGSVALPAVLQALVAGFYPGVRIAVTEVRLWPDTARVMVEDLDASFSLGDYHNSKKKGIELHKGDEVFLQGRQTRFKVADGYFIVPQYDKLGNSTYKSLKGEISQEVMRGLSELPILMAAGECSQISIFPGRTNFPVVVNGQVEWKKVDALSFGDLIL